MKKLLYLLFIAGLLAVVVGCKAAPVLKTPENISLSYNASSRNVEVSFDAVDNAGSYKAYVYKANVLINKYSITPDGKISGLADGTYVIEVQAIRGSSQYQNSLVSAEGKTVTVAKDATKLQTPANIVLTLEEEGAKVRITFDEVGGAKGYKAYFYHNGTLLNSLELTSGALVGMNDGTYVIEIQALGDGASYLSSDISGEGKSVTITNPVVPATGLTRIHFEGMANVDVEYNSGYHILSGVRVRGNDGATYLVNIDVTPSVALNGMLVPDNYSGSITVTYHAQFQNLSTTASRTINVLPEGIPAGQVALGENLVSNSDFTNGATDWVLANHEGASSTLETTGDGGLVRIGALNWSNSSSPRLSNSKLITLEEGKSYRVSFRASAEANKKIFIQVGKLMTSAPWFLDYKPGSKEIFEITPEMKEYSFTFTYNGATSNETSILIEMGIVSGDMTVTNIRFHNIEVREYLSRIEDAIPPQINGATDDSVYIGTIDHFDPLEGISVIDNVDNDLTSRLEYQIYANGQPMDEVDLTKEGTYDIVYSAFDNANNYTEIVRHITVKAIPANQGNLVANGDFTNGISDWEIAQHEGGYADYAFENGKLVFKMDGLNWNGNSSSPRLNTTSPITLIEGKSYKVSFDAYAKDPKTILVQVGKFLSSAPYWIDYKADTYETFVIGRTLSHYEFSFTMQRKTTETAFLSVEMGTVLEDKTITTLYFDNFSFVMLDENIGDYVDPVISGAYNKYYNANEITGIDLLKNITAMDNVDGDVTASLAYEIFDDGVLVNAINFSTPNNYVIRYTAIDTSGNVGYKNVDFVIRGTQTNLFGTNTWTKKVQNGASDFTLTTSSGATTVTLGVNGGFQSYDAMILSGPFALKAQFTCILVLDITSTVKRNIQVKFGRYDTPDQFYQVLSQTITVFPEKTRYMLKFKVTDAFNDYKLGLELGPNYNYEYKQSNITVSKVSIYDYAYHLSAPVGVEFHKIAEGTILAFATVNNAKGYRLYVYDASGNMISGSPFDIFNGINLKSLNLPSGTYTLKIQATGDGLILVDSPLTNGYTYTA